MQQIVFRARKKLSEFLDVNELEYSEWYATNASGQRIKKSRIIYPDVKDNMFLYSKFIENKELLIAWDPLDFFNSLYEGFAFVLEDYKDEHKAFYYATHSIPPPFSLDVESCFYLYSISFLIFKHSEFDFGKNRWPRTFKNFKLWEIGTMVIYEYQVLSHKLGIKIESPGDEYQIE